MVLGVQQPELHGGRRALIARDQVAELAQDVPAHLHHVLVARRGLKGLRLIGGFVFILVWWFKILCLNKWPNWVPDEYPNNFVIRSTDNVLVKNPSYFSSMA